MSIESILVVILLLIYVYKLRKEIRNQMIRHGNQLGDILNDHRFEVMRLEDEVRRERFEKHELNRLLANAHKKEYFVYSEKEDRIYSTNMERMMMGTEKTNYICCFDEFGSGERIHLWDIGCIIEL